MGKKTIVLLVVIVAILASSSFLLVKDGIFGTRAHPRINGTMEIIVIPYFAPGDLQWQKIYDEADRFPGTIKYVVINPCSGPCGSSLDGAWGWVVSSLRERGVKTLGYVYNTNETITNIDYYMKGTGTHTDGIFFDNEGSEDNLNNFKQYADYVHHLGGIVCINPGYNYSYVSGYVSSGESDIANIYELDYKNSRQVSENKALSPWQASVILGNVTSNEEMRSAIEELAKKGIGISYVYGGSYGELPSFFSDEVKDAAGTIVRGGR